MYTGSSELEYYSIHYYHIQGPSYKNLIHHNLLYCFLTNGNAVAFIHPNFIHIIL